jgi:hypothetical protein
MPNWVKSRVFGGGFTEQSSGGAPNEAGVGLASEREEGVGVRCILSVGGEEPSAQAMSSSRPRSERWDMRKLVRLIMISLWKRVHAKAQCFPITE